MQYAMELDRKRKRFFFLVCATITVLVFGLLCVINYLENDIHEIVINLVVMAVLTGGMLALKIRNADQAIYRTVHLVIALAFFYCVYTGAGRESVLYWIFVMPLLFFTFFGKIEGLGWSVAFSGGVGVIMLAPWLSGAHAYGYFNTSRFFITLFFVIAIGYGLESSRHAFGRLLDERNQTLLRDKQRLEEVLAKVNTLSGLLPICAACKRIRDDQGYWNQLEAYFSEHSDVAFSHSLCPECSHKLYPDLLSDED